MEYGITFSFHKKRLFRSGDVVNAFSEWRSHEWKLLAKHLGDWKLLFRTIRISICSLHIRTCSATVDKLWKLSLNLALPFFLCSDLSIEVSWRHTNACFVFWRYLDPFYPERLYSKVNHVRFHIIVKWIITSQFSDQIHVVITS